MDPNRAFQAHNLETLEAALLAANIPYPAQLVSTAAHGSSVLLSGLYQWRATENNSSGIPAALFEPSLKLLMALVRSLQLQDQVAFLINNLSPDNLPTKSDELKGVLTADQWNWFVNYMVVRRAAQVLLLWAHLLSMSLAELDFPFRSKSTPQGKLPNSCPVPKECVLPGSVGGQSPQAVHLPD